jgi:hypothetical protein
VRKRRQLQKIQKQKKAAKREEDPLDQCGDTVAINEAKWREDSIAIGDIVAKQNGGKIVLQTLPSTWPVDTKPRNKS